MINSDETPMPPVLLGLLDQDRAARLVLAICDGNRARYDAAIADAHGHQPELVYCLARNWLLALVESHGFDAARKRLVDILAGITEHHEEIN